VTPALDYVVLLFAPCVVPNLPLRLRVPTAITEMALGVLAGLGLGWFQQDTTVTLLASLGIISLFLFAGLEVDLRILTRHRSVLVQHLLLRIVLLIGGTWLAGWSLGLGPRGSVLLSLALLTPSTGFILSSLPSLGFSKEEATWVKTKAIATEILALLVLFAVTQSTTLPRLGIATLGLAAVIAILPLVFRGFAATIARYAPHSEFAFLLMLAVVCGYATHELGVYYLVGAFVVGWAAGRFRDGTPKAESEELFRSVELFASFFVPFYFFAAGLHLRPENFSPLALMYGAVFLAVGVPIRLFSIVMHRRLVIRESAAQGWRIGLSLSPTLVFCLVIAEIMRDRYGAPPQIFGGLIIYAIGSSLVPILFLRAKPSESDASMLDPPEIV
jgi:Kef-type K+ transport system membrane component KefB